MSALQQVTSDSPLVLTAGRVSVVVDVKSAVPRVLHWGRVAALTRADLDVVGELTARQWTVDGVQQAVVPAIIPEPSSGWMGTPGIEGHRGGSRFSTHFESPIVQSGERADGSHAISSTSTDPAAELELTVHLLLTQSGLLRVSAELTNTANDSVYNLEALRIALPVPAEAREILDFAGRHLRERSPQRHDFTVGTHLREGRRGRTGSDATLLLAAGEPGFGFERGEVWGIHTAWSGNHRSFAEHGLTGTRVLGGGELLLPGEGRLAPGATYRSPAIYASYGDGLDELSAAFHEHLRSRDSHPRSPRPVVLNTWEAVYFDHNLEALTELAELGGRVGAERFVLDDGWFELRRDDRAGLGDWRVDRTVWPDGLQPLIDVVRGFGMDFGLWFEPEMVNEDSTLAREHPEWILSSGERLPLAGRNQQVLNLAIPEAWEYLLESISSLVAEYTIDYIKWDHNRDLVEAGDRATGEPRVHEQTLATYRLMDELRRRHPALEIESCSSGGGRVDLAVLERTDRVWASDCIDALERQHIQRWTGLLLPPELIGSHVGAPTAHTTHRTHSLAFRAATALFGHFGIEWDLRTASADELDELARWVALYKAERELIHSGRVVHSDPTEPSYWTYGVVAHDASRGLFTVASLATGASAQPGRMRIPSLDRTARYRIEPVDLSLSALFTNSGAQPSWVTEPLIVSGEALATIGLQLPMLYPEQALVMRVTRLTPTTL